MNRKRKISLAFLASGLCWTASAARAADQQCPRSCEGLEKRLPIPAIPVDRKDAPPQCFAVGAEGCLLSEAYETSEGLPGRNLRRISYIEKEGAETFQVSWAAEGELLVAAPDENTARASLAALSAQAASPEAAKFDGLCPIENPKSNVFLVSGVDLNGFLRDLAETGLAKGAYSALGEASIEVSFNNPLLAAAPVGDDPYLSSQYYLSDIGLTKAYSYYKDISWRPVTLAIVDNGISAEVVDGVPTRISPGGDFVAGRRSRAPIHGTMMAGIVFSVAKNGQRLAGFAQQLAERDQPSPEIETLIFRSFEDSGVGFEDAAVRGICAAAEQGAKVILGAWVGEGEELAGPRRSDSLTMPFAGLWQALKKVQSTGALWVTAAGNRQGKLTSSTYPAAFKKLEDGGYADFLLVAGATDGAQIVDGTSWGDEVDLGAPGRLLYSQNTSGAIANVPAGTSGAAALAAGAAALIYAAQLQKPKGTIDSGAEIRQRLVDFAAVRCSLRPYFPQGRRLDVAAALLGQASTACEEDPAGPLPASPRH